MHALPPQQQHPLFNLQHDADPAADSCGGQVLLELGADGADVAVGAVHLQHSGGVHGVGWVIGWGGGSNLTCATATPQRRLVFNMHSSRHSPSFEPDRAAVFQAFHQTLPR